MSDKINLADIVIIINPKPIEQLIQELEDLVEIPNVDNDPSASLKGIKMLTLIVNIRASINDDRLQLVNWMYHNAMQAEESGYWITESKEPGVIQEPISSHDLVFDYSVNKINQG